MYKNFDYIIQIDAPFVEREKRVKNRDIFLRKGIMVRRDKDFRSSMRRGKRKEKQVDIRIENLGTIEDLQQIADRIYNDQISPNNQRKTMKEKYGGYKTRRVEQRQHISGNKKNTKGIEK